MATSMAATTAIARGTRQLCRKVTTGVSTKVSSTASTMGMRMSRAK